jgi:hypothetical protein
MFGWASNAQIGGKSAFQFLHLSQSPRTTALGGAQITTRDSDISLGIQSPSLLNSQMHQSLSINHNFYLSDISYGFSAFGYHFEKSGISAMIGTMYLTYGDFVRADEFGNRTGDFGGKDVGIILGAAKEIDERISVGANLKWVTSRLDAYQSNGLGLDLGFTYRNDEKTTITTLVVKNIGLQFSSFQENKEAFPLEVQIGTSRRLKYLPLRLSFTLHNLQNWSLRSEQLENDDPIFIDQSSSQSGALSRTMDNLFRHFIFGGEFLIGQNEVFRLRFSYNHQLKKDLSVSPFRGFNGISLGFGFRIKKIAFDYGFGSYHLAGGVNHISLSTNIQEWKKM